MAARTRPGLTAESEDAEQITRLHRFREQHPSILVGAISSMAWQACIPERGGETVITRRELKDLLDRLDEFCGGPR
jgi:hypothetical protein